MISDFGEHYIRKHLHHVDVRRLCEDWWEALKFFFSRVFYQGRRDDISQRVEKVVREVLSEYFDDPLKRDHEFDRLMSQNWEEVRASLGEKIGKGKVGRRRDIEMTIETLKFISRLPGRNIVRYSMAEIEAGRLGEHWFELQGIKSVGEKTSSLYLRDLVVIMRLEGEISEEDEEYLQPLDTWVMRVCEELGLIEKKPETRKDRTELRRRIVETCREIDVSPIKFNMGAWYMATNALYLLLDRL